MEFVLFAGSLTRFFVGEWDVLDSGLEEDEGDAQDADEDEADGGEDAADEDFDAEDVQAFFEDFRSQVGNALKVPLAWIETSDAPYDARLVAADDYGALLRFAARTVVKDKLPPVDPRVPWTDDPAVQAIQGADKDLQPVHHLINADTWLPADFTPIVQTEVPEQELTIGSLRRLSAFLADLEPQIGRAPADVRRGYAAFKAASDFAMKNGLPMLLET